MKWMKPVFRLGFCSHKDRMCTNIYAQIKTLILQFALERACTETAGTAALPHTLCCLPCCNTGSFTCS